MTLHGKKVQSFGTMSEKALSWVTTHLISEAEDTQSRASKDYHNGWAGSKENRQLFKCFGPKGYNALKVKTNTMLFTRKHIGSQCRQAK